jgi:hypothetical protein
MNVLGWARGPMAKAAMAVGIGVAGGFGTFVVAHAAASPSPTVAPDTSPTPSTGASPSTTTPPSNSTSPGAGSTPNCPNM